RSNCLFISSTNSLAPSGLNTILPLANAMLSSVLSPVISQDILATYFFKMILSSSTSISFGSFSFILIDRFNRIGITTRPNSSPFLIIPVDFMIILLSLCEKYLRYLKHTNRRKQSNFLEYSILMILFMVIIIASVVPGVNKKI